MDNNPTEGQPNQPPVQPAPQAQDPVVFSSTAIASTKSRSSAQYFTKVHKASPWQKFSEWLAKRRNTSQAKMDARQAELKANRAAKKRAAEFAAYNINVPGTPANTPTPTPVAQPAPRKGLIILITAILLVAIVALLLILHPWSTS